MPRKQRSSARRGTRRTRIKRVRVRVCRFCQEQLDYVDFKDVALLREYVSDRGKIRARSVTGVCQKHQKRVATAIKNAREMALLPYVNPRRQDDAPGRRGR